MAKHMVRLRTSINWILFYSHGHLVISIGFPSQLGPYTNAGWLGIPSSWMFIMALLRKSLPTKKNSHHLQYHIHLYLLTTESCYIHLYLLITDESCSIMLYPLVSVEAWTWLNPLMFFFDISHRPPLAFSERRLWTSAALARRSCKSSPAADGASGSRCYGRVIGVPPVIIHL